MTWGLSCPRACGVNGRERNSYGTPAGQRRVRVCPRCGHRWGTLEMDDNTVKAVYEQKLKPPTVHKVVSLPGQDSVIVPFDQTKE